MYGKDDSVEAVSISFFDKVGTYHFEAKKNAKNYCDNINSIEVKDNKGLYATIVEENEKIILRKQPSFDDIIHKLSDTALRRVLLYTKRIDLAKALIDTKKETMEKIYKNIPRRYAIFLQEDMRSFIPIKIVDLSLSRENIIRIIKNLPLEEKHITEEAY
jgi:flagellar motor switch protein FliG